MRGSTIINYKDMTFCDCDCVNTTCHRNFSPEHKEAAAKWWGNDTAPVAFSGSYRDGCEEYKQPNVGELIND